jgi:hypothetical protein
LKNAAERGLFAPYPAFAERRFIKALSALFPGNNSFRIFSNKSRVYAALEHAGILKKNENILDPAFLSSTEMAVETVATWRPFCTCPVASLLAPVLPWSLAPAVLVITERAQGAHGRGMVEKIPPSDMVAPVLLVGATRAIYDLIAEKDAAERNKIFPKITKSLLTERCVWKQNGIYLHTDLDDEAYRRLFQLFLDANFLLPPHPHTPAILPPTLSEGEEANLSRLLALV